MTAACRTRRNVLLVAGGVGITPMRALFETVPLAPGQQLDLLYRARSLEHVVFRNELEGIARRLGARIHYLLGADRECVTAPGLLRRVPDLADRDVFLCGPGGMADATRAGLRDAGLPSGCTRSASPSEFTAAPQLPPRAGGLLRALRRTAPGPRSPARQLPGLGLDRDRRHRRQSAPHLRGRRARGQGRAQVEGMLVFGVGLILTSVSLGALTATTPAPR